MVFLTSEGVRLAVKGIADTITKKDFNQWPNLVKNSRRSRWHFLCLHSMLQETRLYRSRLDRWRDTRGRSKARDNS